MDIYFDYNTPSEVVTNEKAINNSIRNIILTRVGSLPGKPDFGSRIMDQVFELMDGKITEDLLKNFVIEALLKWEPRIRILDVEVVLLPEYNRILINVYYEYRLMGKNMEEKAVVTINN